MANFDTKIKSDLAGSRLGEADLGVSDTRIQFQQLAAVCEGASSRAKELHNSGKLSEVGIRQAMSLINERARA